jgi:hypothetical protein
MHWFFWLCNIPFLDDVYFFQVKTIKEKRKVYIITARQSLQRHYFQLTFLSSMSNVDFRHVPISFLKHKFIYHDQSP